MRVSWKDLAHEWIALKYFSALDLTCCARILHNCVTGILLILKCSLEMQIKTNELLLRCSLKGDGNKPRIPFIIGATRSIYLQIYFKIHKERCSFFFPFLSFFHFFHP